MRIQIKPKLRDARINSVNVRRASVRSTPLLLIVLCLLLLPSTYAKPIYAAPFARAGTNCAAAYSEPNYQGSVSWLCPIDTGTYYDFFDEEKQKNQQEGLYWDQFNTDWEYDVTKFTTQQFPDNTISSIKLPKGFIVEIFTGSGNQPNRPAFDLTDKH